MKACPQISLKSLLLSSNDIACESKHHCCAEYESELELNSSNIS